MDIDVAGHALRLLAGRAIHLRQPNWLLVADVHFGKADTFRRLGVPVPGGTAAAALQRLDALLELTGARRIVFLGDLVQGPHAFGAETREAVAAWRASRPSLDCILVRGNHDARAGELPAAWQVQVVPEPLRVDGLALAHHPRPLQAHYVLAGHVHPCAQVTVPGRRRSALRLPCFHFGPQVGVLPAFGEFTGMQAIQALPQDRVFVIADDRIQPWPPRPPTLAAHAC